MDDVIDQLQALLEQVLQIADEFSEAELAEILNIFTQALELIEGEKAAPTAAAPTAPQVPAGPYPSSNVNGFKYDPKSQQLLVQFHGPYPKADGPIYSYSGVPQYIYDIFSKGAIGPKTSGENRYHRWIKGVTPSLGGSLNALLKAGGFQYQRIS